MRIPSPAKLIDDGGLHSLEDDPFRVDRERESLPAPAVGQVHCIDAGDRH